MTHTCSLVEWAASGPWPCSGCVLSGSPGSFWLWFLHILSPPAELQPVEFNICFAPFIHQRLADFFPSGRYLGLNIFYSACNMWPWVTSLIDGIKLHGMMDCFPSHYLPPGKLLCGLVTGFPWFILEGYFIFLRIVLLYELCMLLRSNTQQRR